MRVAYPLNVLLSFLSPTAICTGKAGLCLSTTEREKGRVKKADSFDNDVEKRGEKKGTQTHPQLHTLLRIILLIADPSPPPYALCPSSSSSESLALRYRPNSSKTSPCAQRRSTPCCVASRTITSKESLTSRGSLAD
jgi:hypothetical protein